MGGKCALNEFFAALATTHVWSQQTAHSKFVLGASSVGNYEEGNESFEDRLYIVVHLYIKKVSLN